MICEGLRTLLLAQSSITDIVGSAGIFVSAARQGSDLPYIVLDRVSDEKYKGLGGYLNQRHCEVDIECWHKTQSLAAALAKIVSNYLDDFTGATGGDETITESTQMDDSDNYVDPKTGNAISEFVTILNFEFHYTE
jgi:hypothetical protein